MPLYEYQCVDCSSRDLRVAGVDDHTALCTECGGLMLRLDPEPFQSIEPDDQEESCPSPCI